MSRAVTLLGSTGSVGRQALEVIAARPDLFRVHALAAHRDIETLRKQIEAFHPERVVVADPEAARTLGVPGGPEALEELAGDATADVVLNAVVGAAGLRSTLAALEAGRLVALANKESCIAGGPLVTKLLSEGSGEIVPVDSEHASTHMCLVGERPGGVSGLVLTASGGPFRGRTRAELDRVSVDNALAHPTWQMGPKITIDSATLMNKGLEVIEANVLFGLDFDRIDVVVHPQSVIHCLVRFVDGSWKSSMSPPDMRVPIAYALGYPHRPDWGAPDVAWAEMAALTFEPLDVDTFPAVRLAYEAGRAGGTAPAVLNAANEVAVQAFLDGRCAFTTIADTVARVLEKGASADLGYGDAAITLEGVLRADEWARASATVDA